MADNAETLGTALGGLGKFASGFFFGGDVADAGTPRRLSDRVKSGLTTAIPAFRQGEATSSRAGLNRAQTNRLKTLQQQDILDQEAANKPVDFKELLGTKLPNRFKDQLMTAAKTAGADIDGNGIVTTKEISKVFSDRSFLDQTNNILTEALGDKGLTAEIAAKQSAVNQMLAKIRMNDPNVANLITEELLLNSPEIAGSYRKEAEAVAELNNLKQNKESLMTAQRMIQERAKSFETPQEAAAKLIADPQFSRDINDAVRVLQDENKNKLQKQNAAIELRQKYAGVPGAAREIEAQLKIAGLGARPDKKAEAGSVTSQQLNLIEREMQDLVPQLFQSDTIGERAIESVRNIYSLFTQQGQRGTAIARYTALVNSSLATFARIVQSEKGTLTEGDVNRAKAAFPDLFGIFGQPDTAKTAENKMRVLHEQLDIIRRDALARKGITPKTSLSDAFNELPSNITNNTQQTNFEDKKEAARLAEEILRGRGRMR